MIWNYDQGIFLTENENEGKRPSIQWECKAHVDVNKKDVFLTIRESQTRPIQSKLSCLSTCTLYFSYWSYFLSFSPAIYELTDVAIPGWENWFFMSQQKEEFVKSLEISSTNYPIKLTSYTCFHKILMFWNYICNLLAFLTFKL